MTTTARLARPSLGWAAAFATLLPLSNVVAQSGAAATSVTATAAYDRVAKAWSSTRTLQANFDQQITNPLLGRTATSRGVFHQQRPNKVSITFTDPVGDRIVGDGTSLWVYLPSSAPGQVLKLPASADGAIVADLLGQLLETPRQNFIIAGGERVTIDGKSTRRVELTPRSVGKVPFRRATLWIDEQEPRPIRVQVVDEQGVDRLITLTSWQPGATLPANTFRFTPPTGVRVQTSVPGRR